MFQALRQIFARTGPAAVAAIPAGQRVYAVGDIHGRLDLFGAMIGSIEGDDVASGPADTTVILLGDLVDRGPASAQVIDLAREWQKRRKVRILAGNHEEMFLRSFEEGEMFRHFIRHGGRETILSYGVSQHQFAQATIEQARALMRSAVPADHRAFMAELEDQVTIGDYLFVHAGIDPSVPLDEQKQHTLRWIREPFLSHGDPHGVVVVHGHTICDAPQDRGNRIGIDTGAYTSGRLTALVLEGTQRRYLTAEVQEDGVISAGSLAA